MVARDLRLVCAIAALAFGGVATPVAAQDDPDFAVPAATDDVAAEQQTSAELSPALSATAVEQRMLVQQGLGLGLASNILQTQLQIYHVTKTKVGTCHQIDQGGSVKLVSKQDGARGKFKAVVEIYYDRQCTRSKIYIHAPLTFWPTLPLRQTAAINELGTTYYSPTGRKLGVLTIYEHAKKLTSSVTRLLGTGHFTRPDDVPVHVGLVCPYPNTLADKQKFTCSIGVAQPFAEFKKGFGSVTTMNVTVHKVTSTSFTNSFTGPATLYTGEYGRLHVEPTADQTKMQLVGPPAPRKYGTSTVVGEERLTVFSPPPTGWTVTDSGHASKFSLKMNTADEMVGPVKHGTTSLATVEMDKSGSGTVTYSNKAKSAIKSWTIGD